MIPGFTDYAPIGLTLGFLTVGAVYDIKKREVPSNWMWVPYGATGFLLTAYRVALEPTLLFLVAVSIIVSIVISFGMWFFGLFAGADFWALVCLGLTMPLPPSVLPAITGYAHPLFPLTVLIMSYLSSLVMVVWYVANNLSSMRKGLDVFAGLHEESSWKKFIAFITGYTVEVARLRSTFYLYPIEEVTEDSAGARRRFNLHEHAESDRDEQVSNLEQNLAKVGSPGTVWATAGLPMLLFFLIGTGLTLILGDPIFYSIKSLAGT